MNDCNATVTTATETDEVATDFDDWVDATACWRDIPDGVAVIRRGYRLMRLDLHPLTCEGDHHPASGHSINRMDASSGAYWWDDLDGATPHVPAVEVSDAEIIAAGNAYAGPSWQRSQKDWNRIRAALVAAKQVAQERACSVCGSSDADAHYRGCTAQEVEA